MQSEKVEQVLDWMHETRANYVRLNPTPKPDAPGTELVGKVSKGALYRASTVLSAWRRSTLLSLLKAGESAWHFEVYGSERSDVFEGFYASRERLVPIVNGVVEGKWQRAVVKKLRVLGVDLDLSRREVMTWGETAVLRAQKIRGRMLRLLPSTYRRRVKDFLLRGQYRYKSNG